MRFDAMIETAMKRVPADRSALAAQWRQLVDLLVQAGGSADADQGIRAARIVEALRPRVPVAQRRQAALALASRITSKESLALFAADEPEVAAPALAAARLTAADWQALIPHLPPISRALLRNRRDLPEAAVRALASLGSADIALPDQRAEAVATEVAPPASQIAVLVDRIEAFRFQQGQPSAAPVERVRAEHFAFESSADGVIDWVDGAARGAIIGISIAETVAGTTAGVDGQAAGAVRRRAPFRDARLMIAGEGQSAGEWRITAAPVFDPRTGRFAGYHGSARRPQPHETSAPLALFAGAAMPVDSLRQLVHELRSPLNAIEGFASMIDMQLLGPAAQAYRSRAHAVVADAQRVGAMIDELDLAARASAEPAAAESSATVASAVLHRLPAQFAAALAGRDVALHVEAANTLPAPLIADAEFERIAQRLAGAMIAVASTGETIAVRLNKNRQRLTLSVSRPSALLGQDTARLLSSTTGPDDGLSLPFGLGFSLRLIDTLARSAGGQMIIYADRIEVALAIAGQRDTGVIQ